MNSSMQLLRNNFLYILWFFVYFSIAWAMLGADGRSLFFCLLFYAVAMLVALSPIGEWFIRLTNHTRQLETNREIDYLVPIFEEVYDEAKEQYPYLPKITVYTIDSLVVNACAMGRHTVAVTRGAMETFSEDELKAVIAHEIGHILYGHTTALLLNIVGNGVFSIFVIVAKCVITILDLLQTPFEKRTRGISYLFISLFRFLFNVVLFLFMFIGNVILSANSRNNEYQADEFAHQIGFGENLIESLYLLQKMSLGEEMELVERMTASHPLIAKRIGRLETLQEQESEEEDNDSE